MSYIITQAELEHMTEMQLRGMYHGIISDYSNRKLSAQDCSLARITLENILRILSRKQPFKPPAPRF